MPIHGAVMTVTDTFVDVVTVAAIFVDATIAITFLDVMTVVVEHPDASKADDVAKAIRSHCEIRCAVEVVGPNTLPKSEMKAKRVFDERNK